MSGERCPVCKKVCYANSAHAKADIAQMQRKQKAKLALDIYRCEAGHLHVGHSTDRRMRRKRPPPRQRQRGKWNWRRALDLLD